MLSARGWISSSPPQKRPIRLCENARAIQICPNSGVLRPLPATKDSNAGHSERSIFFDVEFLCVFTQPVLRLLSGLDDYFSWFVVFLPLLTGMAAMSGSSPQLTSSGTPLYPLPLAIHLLSVELLFLWLPFGKLAHAFLVFMSRGITGAALARKGAAL
jgi:hypothetical protein